MTISSDIDNRKNKSLIVNNKSFLKEYALKNYNIYGSGIIVINLLLLNTDSLNDLNLTEHDQENGQEYTIQQPIAYIPKSSFWFKMISLKIKKKYKIDIHTPENMDDKFFIVFVKDASIEYFSIYSLKLSINSI
ncbi:hypothetical protein NIES4102_32090 [Chondrocystis sp. NIES-4102]|nr:hypothetical protein NIES4102_32090 [Chondrocystis sp. NIES-4102]